MALYQWVAQLVRAYANLADNLIQAGYSEARSGEIKLTVTDYTKLRANIR